MLFLFAFVVSRLMLFLRIFWSPFRWGTSCFISAFIAQRFNTTLRSFSFRCSFRGSPTLGETYLLLCPWSLFDLIREGLFSRSLEPLSLPNKMVDLCFKTEVCFIILTKFYSNFVMAEVISDFKLQAELWRSFSYSEKDWKRTGHWAPVWYRLCSKNAGFDYLRFYEIKSCFHKNK